MDGNTGFTGFRSPRYPASTAQQTWPHQRSTCVEDRVWSPRSGRFEGLQKQQEVFARQASSEPVLKQTETHHRSATSNAFQNAVWSDSPEGTHHSLTGQNTRFMPGHSPHAHSGQPQFGHSSYSPSSQSYPTGLSAQSHQDQSSLGQSFQDDPLSSESLSLQEMFKDVGDSFSCPLCQYSFAADGQLWDHVRTAHKKSICVPCKKVFNSFASLCYHRNVKHGHSDHLKCGVCGKFFGHKQHMRSHMINVHKDYSNM